MTWQRKKVILTITRRHDLRHSWGHTTWIIRTDTTAQIPPAACLTAHGGTHDQRSQLQLVSLKQQPYVKLSQRCNSTSCLGAGKR